MPGRATRRQAIDLEAFLTRLFTGLREAGVDYCVLRNHDELPYRNPGTDIDLLVHAANREAALAAVGAIGGLAITGRVRRAAATHLFVAGVEWSGHAALQIDFMTAVVHKGIPFLGTGHVLERSRPAAPDRPLVRVPHPADEAVISFLSSFLVGGWVKERYQAAVRTVFTARPGEVEALLAPAFGAARAARLVGLVAAGREDEALAAVPDLRRALLLRALRRRPLGTLAARAVHYAREAEIRWTPRYVDDVYLRGGPAPARAAFAEELAGAIAHMAKDVRVLRPEAAPLRRPARLRHRLLPDVRNRAVRIWTDLPPGGAGAAGLVLDVASAGGATAILAARDAVRDHLARTAGGRAAP